MKLQPLLYRYSATAAAFVTLQASALSAQSAAPPSPSPSPTEQLYTVLIYETPSALADRTTAGKRDAYWSAYDRFAEALIRAGALRGGSALSESEYITVRGTGSMRVDGRSARLGGYFVIAAKTRGQAEALARLAPAAATKVELRPHRDNPHMTATTR